VDDERADAVRNCDRCFEPARVAILRGTGGGLFVELAFIVSSLVSGRPWASLFQPALLLMLLDLVIFNIGFVRSAHRKFEKRIAG
jgi:hypothetical protein